MALCGLAANFLQLRMTVAVGEAGCHPPAFSLIADHFSRAERPRAVARYMLGWPLALIAGFFVGGWLNQVYGWRTTFVILGLPGIVLALAAALTITEPRKLCSGLRPVDVPPSTSGATSEPRLRDVLSTLLRNATYRNLLLAFSLSYFFGNGILQWVPAFFVRSYGLESGVLGTWLAVIYGFGGLLGTWLGGELASRYAARNETLQLKALALIYALYAIVGASVYLTTNLYVAFVALMIGTIISSVAIGPMFAATQTLVPASMRAMSIAIVMLLLKSPRAWIWAIGGGRFE